MSDSFEELMGKAKEMAGEALDRAKDAAAELRDAAASGELKDKAVAAAQTAKEKAAPVLDRVMDAAGDAVERVKDGVNQILTGDKPPLNVDNPLFDGLEKEAAQHLDAARKQAEEMQKKIEEMLGEKKDGE